MAFFNNFTNINMDYFSGGLNNWTSWFNTMPSFSGWSMPLQNNFNFDFNSVFSGSGGFNSMKLPAFSMPSFDFSNIFSSANNWNTNNSTMWNNSFSWDTSFQPYSTGFTTSNLSFTNKNKTKLSDVNYDAKKGEKLTKTALSRSVGWTGYCARYVKTAIKNAGLGRYESGHAYQMPDILRRNNNFKEIGTSQVNVKDLPSGCILVYNRGSQGYSSEYGHVEITTGDGRAVSDGITKHLYKKPDAIFVPVSA